MTPADLPPPSMRRKVPTDESGVWDNVTKDYWDEAGVRLAIEADQKKRATPADPEKRERVKELIERLEENAKPLQFSGNEEEELAHAAYEAAALLREAYL